MVSLFLLPRGIEVHYDDCGGVDRIPLRVLKWFLSESFEIASNLDGFVSGSEAFGGGFSHEADGFGSVFHFASSFREKTHQEALTANIRPSIFFDLSIRIRPCKPMLGDSPWVLDLG